MKEHPILFNAEMVNAILAGNKTQTRRIIKNWQQPKHCDEFGFYAVAQKDPRYGFCVHGKTENECAAELAKFGASPFGKVGDRLWVRETFSLLSNEDGVPIDWDENLIHGDKKNAARIYKASCHQAPNNYGIWSIPGRDMQFDGNWTPSIHMPRWASRITLEITAVRVERLQGISEEDALAEGVRTGQDAASEGAGWYDKPRRAFQFLWQSIYGAESWATNPWVWVIEFKRVAS